MLDPKAIDKLFEDASFDDAVLTQKKKGENNVIVIELTVPGK